MFNSRLESFSTSFGAFSLGSSRQSDYEKCTLFPGRKSILMLMFAETVMMTRHFQLKYKRNTV